MAFCKQSLDFLFENYARDDKEWFREHKADYQRYIIEPFAEFINDIAPTIHKIDSTLICTPRRISRLYRDARFTRDSIFRDTVWCTISHGKELYEGLPALFMEFSPRCYRYGFGYYRASADSNNAIRELILANDKSYRAARAAFDKQQVFALVGDPYKRDRFPAVTDRRNEWLNCRSLGFIHTSEDFERFFSDDFAASVAADLLLISPIYKFLMKAEQNAATLREAGK